MYSSQNSTENQNLGCILKIKIDKSRVYSGPGVPWALGDPGPWGPLGLGDPWALGTLGPFLPWALGLGDPWALGAHILYILPEIDLP